MQVNLFSRLKEIITDIFKKVYIFAVNNCKNLYTQLLLPKSKRQADVDIQKC